MDDMDDSQIPAMAPRARRSALVVAAVVVVASVGAYTAHEYHAAQKLTAQNQQLTAQLAATHQQFKALSARVNEMAASEAKPSPEVPVAKPAPHTAPVAARGHAVALRRHIVRHRGSAEDARFKKLQSQVDAQGQEIDAERADLAGTRTQLSGSIARTHDELVALEKKGQKNYFEFDLMKSREYQREGPLSVRLRKANVKHQFANLMLIVDDRTLTQKHVNLYQPVSFYEPGLGQPIEVVINRISKNHIHGYVSAPRYNASELASDQAANPGGEPTLRQRLPLPAPPPGQP